MQSGVDPEGGVRTNPTPPPSEKKKFFASNSCRESVEFSEVNGRLGWIEREVGVAETGLEELSLKKDMCIWSVTTKKVIRFFEQENEPP